MAETEDSSKNDLCSLLGFQLGALPVKYFGAPSISTTHTAIACQSLFDKVDAKIRGWANRYLS